ncbi:MAG: sulfite exporter TauE/SafE family protein, partial [Rhodospirillaceae bacterium]|nr:sulfite exporter TauE/SafE family protein [Rhodospirillaceae bacterium]
MSIETLLVFIDIDLAIAIGIIIVAAIISGYTGFGGALFQVPLMVMLFGPVEAVAVTRLVSMFGRAQLYPSSARTANWSEVFPLVLAIIVITPFASSVLFIADPDLIRRGIGGLVIALTILMMSGCQYRGPRRWPASLSFGAVCGALAGIAGI